MKRGSMNIVVLIIVAVVLGLSLTFVLNASSNPTGYAGSPVGAAITSFVPSVPCGGEISCESSAVCQETQDECCDSGMAGCSFGVCTCIDPCEVGNECDPGGEDGQVECGGVQGDDSVPAGICDPTNPDGGNGACRCEEPCPEGAYCSTFGVSSHPFDNPCGPNGHCVITGSDDGGMLTGQCACNPKGCEFTDDDDKDQCPDTVKCNEGSSCTKSSQCGGSGVGACVDGACDCECVSWAPCQEDEDCGPAGDCVTGPDGAFECMCANDFGCSFDQCEPGVTPCDDSEDCFGASCQTTDGVGVCQECGVSCEFFCEDGNCPEPDTQADCNALGAALGGAVCTLDDSCDCIVPQGVCNNGCLGVGEGLWCPD